MLSRLSKLSFSPRNTPLALALLSLAAYGLLAPKLGFYWDDWSWVWIGHLDGVQGMLRIDRAYRPLAGVILGLGSLLAGERPLGWQLLNLAYRWLTAATLWWALSKLWPRQKEQVSWIALLFLVYPGFRQQYASVNSSRHILPLAIFFLSIGCMVWVAREKKRALPVTLLALGLEAAHMLATDYYLGLELIRPAMLWLALEGKQPSGKERWKETFFRYIPYLSLLAVVSAWRYSVSKYVNYPVTFTAELTKEPLATLLKSGKTLVNNLAVALPLAWAQVFAFPGRAEYGLRWMALYWCLVLAASGGVFIYLNRLPEQGHERRFAGQALGLGGLALLVGGLPFLLTDIPIGLSFPADRATLPLMLGASLVWVGLSDGLVQKRRLQQALISLAVGLAVGMHFLSAFSYQKDWETQRDFFYQLTWRVQGLKPHTAIFYAYSLALKDFRSTDNSLTAPLNWIFAPHFNSGEIPYEIFDLRLRSESRLPALKKGQPIRDRYGEFPFTGTTEDVLVVAFTPPACLRVLQPELDVLNPLARGLVEKALPLSNPQVIVAQPTEPARLPKTIFGAEPPQGWCSFFEAADLASQLGEWRKVVDLGETAFKLKNHPKHPSERVPFILGYAHLGLWGQAQEQSEKAFRDSRLMGAMLCAAWEEIDQSTADTAEKAQAVEAMRGRLGCEGK